MRIAVIGSGVSGSVVARLLHSQHEVVLFEASDYVGGHANTVQETVAGRQVWADTGFMVFNQRTYPNFCRLLGLLDIESQPSDMSFSVHCDRSGLEYQGSSLNGLFAQRINLLRPSFYKLLRDIFRFNKVGTSAALAYANPPDHGDTPSNTRLPASDETVGQFLERHSLGDRFIHQYLVPMAAAIWSSEPSAILDFPARFMIGFFNNHGLMQLADRPIWRTIVGGSRKYLAKLLQPMADCVRLNCAVHSVRRKAGYVQVISEAGDEQFDQVIMAIHADQCLKLIADPTHDETATLTCFPYQANDAVLHTDTQLLPKRSAAWASWNYRIPQSDQNHLASVTYDLNRLQNLGLSQPLLLTLNDTAAIDPAKIIRSFVYHHPSYQRSSIEAQLRHSAISGLKQRTHYCGAYWGYGFHEDGVNSALTVAKQFGLGLESCSVVSTKAMSATAVLNR